MWTADVIAGLAAAKAECVDFETAWESVILRFPPRGRDLGPTVPSLLDEDESPADFLRRVAEDAWHGRCPVLRHLANAMELIEVLDEPGVAVARQAGGRSHLAAGDY